MIHLRKLAVLLIVTAACGAAGPAYAIDLDIDIGVGVDVDAGPGGVEVGVGADGVDLGLSLGDGPGAGALPLDAVALDHEGALKAVREEKALPLAEILKRAEGGMDGEVIDAQLIAVRGFLLYELKVLSTGGQLADAYFYAQSGRPVLPR